MKINKETLKEITGKVDRKKAAICGAICGVITGIAIANKKMTKKINELKVHGKGLPKHYEDSVIEKAQ